MQKEKALDLAFRGVNGIAAVANGYAFAVPPDSRSYVVCKGITIACDTLSYLTLHAKNSLTLHRAEKKKIPEPKINKHFLNFVVHEAASITAAIVDFRSLLGVSPQERLIDNAGTMLMQGMNAVLGTDPNRIAQQVAEYKI